MNSNCFNCGEKGEEFYGFTICESCKKDIRLFTDKTVERHINTFSKQVYQADVEEKLALLENNYIKKKNKLLDILSKLEK